MWCARCTTPFSGADAMRRPVRPDPRTSPVRLMAVRRVPRGLLWAVRPGLHAPARPGLMRRDPAAADPVLRAPAVPAVPAASAEAASAEVPAAAEAAAVALAEAASAAENADNKQTIPRDIVAGYCFAIVRGNATLCKLNNACFAGESACFRTYISFQHRRRSSKIGICTGVEKVVETVDNSL